MVCAILRLEQSDERFVGGFFVCFYSSLSKKKRCDNKFSIKSKCKGAVLIEHHPRRSERWRKTRRGLEDVYRKRKHLGLFFLVWFISFVYRIKTNTGFIWALEHGKVPKEANSTSSLLWITASVFCFEVVFLVFLLRFLIYSASLCFLTCCCIFLFI